MAKSKKKTGGMANPNKSAKVTPKMNKGGYAKGGAAKKR